MTTDDTWPWLALGVLGAYHGVNPAMGWLFAVALGLQERRRGAVLQALVPITLGHEASIALAAIRRAEPAAALPGDVVVFRDTYKPGPSHTGIALGDGRFVHAAEEWHGVVISALGDGYWGPRFHVAGRPSR